MKINVPHVAKLANLELSSEETKELGRQLEKTLDHVDRLKEIDTTHVEGTNEVTSLKNVFREDEVVPSLSQAKALLNAKQTYNGFFVVPVILEEAIE
jgi:aspartyl-tRNA(Asn)/glutamyl-tRNA(Gln) amidotransferase subunit C